MTNAELDLVPTEELTRAIGRRCKAFFLITEKDSMRKSDDFSDRWISYDGGWSTALGLAEYGKHKLLSLPFIGKGTT